MNAYIKNLIEVNKLADKHISILERECSDITVDSDKAKANFGNMCIILKGFRMVSEATEAMLINENVIKSEDGEFYKKINTDKTSKIEYQDENTNVRNE